MVHGKVCSTDPAKGDRRGLVGAAVGVNAVYGTLFQDSRSVLDILARCSIINAVSGDTQMTIEGCWLSRKYSKASGSNE